MHIIPLVQKPILRVLLFQTYAVAALTRALQKSVTAIGFC